MRDADQLQSLSYHGMGEFPRTQGLEMQLSILESLLTQHLGEDDQPIICVECYCEADECSCPDPLYWPLPPAVYKLRIELSSACGAQ